jgi:predicted dehydrogenase
MQAVLRGVHAIVEKPICGSMRQMNTMIHYDFARNACAYGRVCPVFQYRFAGHEEVGLTINSTWQRSPRYWNGWRGDWHQALGGVLTSHGVHFLDLLIQEHGVPEAVWAAMDCDQNVETAAQVRLQYGEQIAELNVAAGPDLETAGFDLGDSQKGYVEQFRRLHAALNGKAPMPVDIFQARDVLEVLTAAYASVRSNDLVRLPLGPDHQFLQGWSGYFGRLSQPSQSSPRISVSPDHPTG